jgi:hypothetical protein
MLVVPLPGYEIGWPVRDGIVYLNGAILTNTMAVLRLSGFLPQQFNTSRAMQLHWASLTNSPRYDPEKLRKLQADPGPRIVSGEVTRPITDLARAFRPHPL